MVVSVWFVILFDFWLGVCVVLWCNEFVVVVGDLDVGLW